MGTGKHRPLRLRLKKPRRNEFLICPAHLARTGRPCHRQLNRDTGDSTVTRASRPCGRCSIFENPNRTSDNPFVATPIRNISPWTRSEKVRRLLWAIVAATLFRFSFHNWYGVRTWLLKLFGARLGRNVRIRRTAKIEIPWNLDIGDDVSIGDAAILYSLGMITIGARSFLSQYAHLCAGTHDPMDRNYPLIRPAITLGTDCWIAADAFVGPGVTIGDRTVVGARASVFSDLPGDVIAVGNPAKPIKARTWHPGAQPPGAPATAEPAEATA